MRVAEIIAAATLIIGASLVATPANAGETTALFRSDEPITITIAGPVREIVKEAASSTTPLAATLSLGDETHKIELSARGNARRRPENCTFPPLRVKFTTPPPEESLFRKQKSLKLVTHCQSKADFQQHTLLEYAAYKMYNTLTDESFKVRLATVRYVEKETGEVVTERVGFFIEDADDVADRVDKKEVNAATVTIAQHNNEAAARSVLFFHMIGNHDWSMLAGPDGECCHNGKLLGATKTASESLVFLPYDFDYSGFVDTPYAIPPDSLSIRSVRSRYYRGDCSLNAAISGAAPHFRDRRAAVETAIRATPGLEQKSADKAVKYLAGFYEDIADDDAVAKLVKRCR